MKKKLKQIFLDIKNDQIAEEFSGTFRSTIFVIFKKLFQSNSLIYFRTREFALSNKKKIKVLRNSIAELNQKRN